MRRLPVLLVILGGLVLPAGAGAAGLSISHEPLASGTSHAACLARAQAAIRSAGLRVLNTTRDAAWGENGGSDQLYTIYCITERGVAVMVGAADRSDQVDPVVTRLRSAFRSVGGGTGPQK